MSAWVPCPLCGINDIPPTCSKCETCEVTQRMEAMHAQHTEALLATIADLRRRLAEVGRLARVISAANDEYDAGLGGGAIDTRNCIDVHADAIAKLADDKGGE